jgi:hypothetical protein
VFHTVQEFVFDTRNNTSYIYDIKKYQEYLVQLIGSPKNYALVYELCFLVVDVGVSI